MWTTGWSPPTRYRPARPPSTAPLGRHVGLAVPGNSTRRSTVTGASSATAAVDGVRPHGTPRGRTPSTAAVALEAPVTVDRLVLFRGTASPTCRPNGAVDGGLAGRYLVGGDQPVVHIGQPKQMPGHRQRIYSWPTITDPWKILLTGWTIDGSIVHLRSCY